MKTKTLLILLAIITISRLSISARTDTVWTSYHWKGYNVRILGGSLNYHTRTKINIEADIPGKKLEVTFNKGKLEKINTNWYYITPTAPGISEIAVNKQVYEVDVLPMREPNIYLDGQKKYWKEVITRDELVNSTGMFAKSIDTTFEIIGFEVTVKKQSDIITTTCQGSKFTAEAKKIIVESDGDKIYFENIVLKNPDGTYKMYGTLVLNVIDNFYDEFIRKTVSYFPNTSDLSLQKTDLRIKIEGNPTPEAIKTITNIAEELNSLLETIKVKIVTYQPNLRIIFDSVFDDALLKIYDENTNLTMSRSNMYFPFYTSRMILINTKNNYDFQISHLKKSIINCLGNFKPSYYQIGNDSSILSNANHLSDYDKYMLKTLYSNGGEAKVMQLLDTNITAPEDKTGIFILSLVICIVLLFVFYQLYHYYGIEHALDKFRNKWLKLIIESILVAQIPSLTFLLLLLEKFFTGDFHEAGFILYLEIFFVPFSLLVGLLFLLLDTVLNRIKKVWIVVVLNFIGSFFSIWLAYQLLYLYLMPDLVTLGFLTWKLVLVAFLIVAYRIYSRFQTAKITGLLQEKELELTRQKELTLKSDLMALQSRINPHFLYNSLNSIASLVYIDATKTEKMAISLSKLFRYNINKGNELFSTIQSEIEIVELYLSIEKNRFEDKLSYSIEVQETLQDFSIPRFLLQPLVENAVKHGISNLNTPGEIKIKIFENEQKVIFEIYDNGPKFPDGLLSGYGLQNTYEKLKHVYKKSFDIEFVNSPQKKMVIILAKK